MARPTWSPVGAPQPATTPRLCTHLAGSLRVRTSRAYRRGVARAQPRRRTPVLPCTDCRRHTVDGVIDPDTATWSPLCHGCWRARYGADEPHHRPPLVHVLQGVLPFD